MPDDPNARREIEKFLKAGALGIGEQKYALECDSEPMQRIFAISQDHQIPVLLHIQHGAFNMGIERFYKIVEKDRQLFQTSGVLMVVVSKRRAFSSHGSGFKYPQQKEFPTTM